jgi:hypothetical protein
MAPSRFRDTRPAGRSPAGSCRHLGSATPPSLGFSGAESFYGVRRRVSGLCSGWGSFSASNSSYASGTSAALVDLRADRQRFWL